jgi:hypothetical protein
VSAVPAATVEMPFHEKGAGLLATLMDSARWRKCQCETAPPSLSL